MMSRKGEKKWLTPCLSWKKSLHTLYLIFTQVAILLILAKITQVGSRGFQVHTPTTHIVPVHKLSQVHNQWEGINSHFLMRALLHIRKSTLFVLMAEMISGNKGMNSGAVVGRKIEKSSISFTQMREGNFINEAKEIKGFGEVFCSLHSPESYKEQSQTTKVPGARIYCSKSGIRAAIKPQDI